MMLLPFSDELLQKVNSSRASTRLILLGVAAYYASTPLLQRGLSSQDARYVLGWLGFVILLEITLSAAAIQLARQGSRAYLAPLAWTGVLLIAGGIWSDVLATVFYSPDMAQEGNSIIVFLRDNGFPLWVQYLTGFTAQSLLTVILCALWVAFVRHFPFYKAALLAMRPQSLIEFLWASLGGQTYFSKTQKLNLSRSYRLIWWLIPPVIMPFNRYLLALGWMGVITQACWLVPMVSFWQSLLALVLLFSGLIYIYFENRHVLRSDPAFTRLANRANLKEGLIRLLLLAVFSCVLLCFSSLAYLWATREPEYLAARIESVPETMTVNKPFPITLIIENIGAKDAVVSRIETTAWEPEGTTVSDKLLFFFALPVNSATKYEPQTTLKTFEGATLAPGETIELQLWLAGREAGDVLLKTSIYSGWREKMIEPIPLTISP
ncbi:MAG: hypothetical protein ACUVRJ_07155 [Candidatus Villigracilaceae bacterium]